ncbi:MAG: flavin reductase [Prevotellaceae bacterium]|jgi:flavin reductase (DIM6/NTAB) family NADH-FMN oxidoreductase RutF|nr:flavin reductase [Prevotellaceae bacterium]
MKKYFISLVVFVIMLCGCTGNKIAKSMNDYREIDIRNLRESAGRLIGEDWTLITAGDSTNFNTMTASWGTLGHLWNRHVAIVFVRPQRYTFEFMENGDYFTLSFFEMEKYRPALQLLGTKSGRDGDKVSEAGLTPLATPYGVSFGEANMIIECKKIYSEFLNPKSFIDTTIIDKVYPQKDFHKMYVGEILGVWRR